MFRPRGSHLWVAIGLVTLGGGLIYWLTRTPAGDPHLAEFVYARPPVAIVFTSRSDAASLRAAASEGEGFIYPGQRLWAATEGRLRLLTPRGDVHELSWNKPLRDGGTLIDVMSPSVSIDGKRVLFAGRRGDDHGRFRLYEIGIDGHGLRALTGGSDDEGCVAVPPMRWRADGTMIPDAERRAIDYDDIDPAEDADRRIHFVSSRTPDLGRDHARRSTTLWVRHSDGKMHPATANRNNDRWPVVLRSRYVAFSLWSRNREVVTLDRRDVRPGVSGMTLPTDAWLGAFTQLGGGHFGMLVKPALPVWRPRPLFAKRIAFMTSFGDDSPLTVVQVPPGYLANAPSAVPSGRPLPTPEGGFVRRGPDCDPEGRQLWLATPGPCPPAHVLLAGARLADEEKSPSPGSYGIYLARDEWKATTTASEIDLKLLFDDPELTDAEPAAAYARQVGSSPADSTSVAATPPAELTLSGSRSYRGPMGQVFATGLDSPTMMGDLPGQLTNFGEGPVFDGPPAGTLDHLVIYAARRDRFDDAERPRVAGTWERLLTLPVKGGAAASWAPTDSPTVLAGFDKEGRVAEWTSTPKDSQVRQATFLAVAGDHYSLTRPGGKHFCVGCHPGHSGFSAAHHDHAERTR